MEPLPGDAVAAQPQPPWCREIEIKLFQTCQSRAEVGRQFNQTPAPVETLFPSPGRRCHLRDQGNTGVSDHFPIFYVWTITRFCSQVSSYWPPLRFKKRTEQNIWSSVFRYRVSSGHGHNVHHLRYLGTLNSTEDRELSGRVFYRYK